MAFVPIPLNNNGHEFELDDSDISSDEESVYSTSILEIGEIDHTSQTMDDIDIGQS